jgi:hypothetical protein
LWDAGLTRQQQEEARLANLRNYREAMGELRLQKGQIVPRAESLAADLKKYSKAYYEPSTALARYKRTFKDIERGYGALPKEYAAGSKTLVGDYGRRAEELRAEFAGGEKGITAGYDERLRRAMGMLEGYGTQMSTDIDERFARESAEEQANLMARGLGGTTVTNAMRAGSERRRLAEQRRLGEDLTGLRTGMYADLSGEGLTAAERMLGARTGLAAGLTGETLAASQRAGEFGAGLGLESLAGRGDIARGELDYTSQAMQNYLANMQAYGQLPLEWMMATQRPITDVHMGTQWYGPSGNRPAEAMMS